MPAYQNRAYKQYCFINLIVCEMLDYWRVKLKNTPVQKYRENTRMNINYTIHNSSPASYLQIFTLLFTTNGKIMLPFHTKQVPCPANLYGFLHIAMRRKSNVERSSGAIGSARYL